jgi:ubiquinone/menaquinone biosynthesis C-methylase UbiE
MDAVESWYDNEYDEWSRLDRHRVEFEITRKYLDTYISGNALEILDIGGGPGRYSLYLAGKGHKVTLLDLSQHNIDIAGEKSKELGIPLEDRIKGNALDLRAFPEEKFDVVLLMGPLYHLVRLEDRRKALEEALRLLKKGGVIIASFISNYAPFQEAFIYMNLDGNADEISRMLHFLENGENEAGSGFTVAYFTGMEEAQALMAEQGVKQLAFAGVENVLGLREREIINLSKEDFDKYIDVGYILSQDRNLAGISFHYLYVGQKQQ